jgi:RND family efflux transporter MFP subunit
LDTAESVYNVALNRYEGALEETRTRQAALAQRRAEYELAKQQLSDTTVRAPFSGVLQARLIDPGEFLSAGAPVAELVQVDPLRLRLDVPEREAAVVRSGQTVRLTVEGDTNIFQGVLSRVSPALEETGRVLRVEADVPSRGILRPGLFARAQLVTQSDDPGLAVPPSALVVFCRAGESDRRGTGQSRGKDDHHRPARTRLGGSRQRLERRRGRGREPRQPPHRPGGEPK